MYDMIHMPFICGFGCEDWLPEITAKERARRVLADAHDGEIVLLHDMENNQATVDALRRIIPALKSMGYGLVNIRELFRKYDICPSVGRTYSGVFDIRPDDFVKVPRSSIYSYSWIDEGIMYRSFPPEMLSKNPGYSTTPAP